VYMCYYSSYTYYRFRPELYPLYTHCASKVWILSSHCAIYCIHVQRGLCHMRLYCYRTCAESSVQEQLWLCSEYVHAVSVEPYAEFYIREDRVSLALLIDPLMKHVRNKDMYI